MQQLRIDIEASQNTPEAIAAREAADQRLLEAGRAPGWSLMLNPTKAMVEESPFLTADDFVSATQRGHMLEATRYARDQRRSGRAKTVLEATADHPRQHMQHNATVAVERPEHRPPDQDGQHHGHGQRR